MRDLVCTDPAICGKDPINEQQAAGIDALFIELPGTVIKENTVISNDIGVYLFGSEGCCETSKNHAKNNRCFGIVIQDRSNDTADNRIEGGEVGIGVIADFVDTVAVRRKDKISKTSVLPIQEMSCCGSTATAIVKKH